MTLQEIAQEMLREIDKYAVVKETQVPKFVQARTHKKWRINKKWKNRYGMKIVYETKRAKVVDVTVETIIEFCREHELPLPEELLSIIQ